MTPSVTFGSNLPESFETRLTTHTVPLGSKELKWRNSLHWGDCCRCFSPRTPHKPTLLSLNGGAILQDLSPRSQVHLTEKDCKSNFCPCASDPQLKLTLCSAVGNISDSRDILVCASRWKDGEGWGKQGMIMTRTLFCSCVMTRNFPQVTLAQSLLTHMQVHCHAAGFLKSNPAFPPLSLLFVTAAAEKKGFPLLLAL